MDSSSRLGTTPLGRPGKLAAKSRLLPFDEAVATKWGEIQADAQLRGRPRPINDSWIAACCLAHGLPLATFNTKDFGDFAEHDGLSLIRERVAVDNRPQVRGLATCKSREDSMPNSQLEAKPFRHASGQ